MIQSGDRITTPSSAGRLWDQMLGRVALLRSEVALGSPDLARLGLLSLALAMQTAVGAMPGHFRPAGSIFFAVLVPTTTLCALALTLVATLPLRTLVRPERRRMLAAIALLLLSVLSAVGVVQGVKGVASISNGMPYTNDGAVMDLAAAQQVRDGHNPYLKSNIVTALAAINAPAHTVTPLMQGQFRGSVVYPTDPAIERAFLDVLRYRDRPGVPVPVEFESKYNYPAGSFLLILPFVFAGIQDMRFLYALAALGMGLYIWFRMPRALRILVPLLLLADTPVITHTIGGQPDTIYAFFLMLGLAEWRTRWLSPLAVALAVAIKQLAWFFIPFYMVLIWKRFGRREAMRRSAITVATFAILNGPFILQSPGAYISSVTGPMSDPMFPLGIGVIALFVSNVLPMLPKIAFTLAELGAWALALAGSMRVRLFTPASYVVLAALPVFFAWRSLDTYFYLIPLLALAVVLRDTTAAAEPART